MEERLQRTPSDFAEILSRKELPLLVGGQAVNIWAEIYSGRVPPLQVFDPFVSRDADIFGTRELAVELGKTPGWNCRVVNERDSIVAAVLTKTQKDGKELTIEVLSEVNGMRPEDLEASETVETDVGQFRVPSPLVLLRAKLYNLASLVLQLRPQDKRHAQMLQLIAPAYLRDLAVEATKGSLEKEVFDRAVRYARELQRTGFARDMATAHELSLSALIPLEIEHATGPCPSKAREHERER